MCLAAVPWSGAAFQFCNADTLDGGTFVRPALNSTELTCGLVPNAERIATAAVFWAKGTNLIIKSFKRVLTFISSNCGLIYTQYSEGPAAQLHNRLREN